MSPDLSCIGTPISWLRLELHHAGELASAEERAAITAHLATCDACAACLAQIEAEAALPLRPLPVLPLPAPLPASRRVSLLRRLAPPLAALAVAAGVLLVLGRGSHSGSEGRRSDLDPGAARTKGGDVAFVLVRDDDSLVAEAGGSYRDGDRWKALVSCPAGMRASWDLVVFEHGDVEFPFAAPGDLTCGNDVPLGGAFRTTGHDAMTVCLVWSDGAMVDRDALRRASPEVLPHASCKRLVEAP